MAMKKSDLFAAYGCSSCHDEVDRRTCEHTFIKARLWFYEGVFRTQAIWLKEGLIEIK
jgi:hypothetical protein